MDRRLLREISEDDFIKIGKAFNTPLGKEALSILNKVFYNTVSFTPDSPDVGAFKEGQRDLVQVIRNAAAAVDKQEKDKGDE